MSGVLWSTRHLHLNGVLA